MYHFKPEDIPEQHRYKFMIGTVVPRPIALISTQSTDGVLNIAPFSYFNIVTHRPMILSVSIARKAGVMKDTARNIVETGVANVQVVDMDAVQDANATAAPLDKHESELTLTNFSLSTLETSDVPGLKESKVIYETALYQHITIEHDATVTTDMFLLKVNAIHIDEGIYDVENGYVDVAALNPVARLAGDDYMEMGKTFTIQRPR